MKKKFGQLTVSEFRAIRQSRDIARYLSRDPARVNVALQEAMKKGMDLNPTLSHRVLPSSSGMNEKWAAMQGDFWTSLLLIRESVLGHYQGITSGKCALFLAVIVYFLNPADLIPDFLGGVGYIDDLTLMGFVFSFGRKSLKDFTKWQESHGANVRELPVRKKSDPAAAA